jgi:Fe-S cluster assembly protein SufD
MAQQPSVPPLHVLQQLGFRLTDGQPAWLRVTRQTGADRFAELGFPTLNHEDWRYTNLAPLTRLPFRPATPGAGLTPADLGALTFMSQPAHRLVFVDGHYAPALSSPGAVPAGITLRNLAAVLAENAASLEPHLARLASAEVSGSFTALNTALFTDGAFLHVPAGQVLELPVHLLYVSTGRDSGAASHPRNLFLIGDHARATLLESFVSLGDAPALTNAVTEIVVGNGAVVEQVKFQDESREAFHVAALHARLGRASNFLSHSFALGAKLSRNNLRCKLAGEGLETILNGLYLTNGDQLADHHMIVEHAEPNCASHEYFNGILDGKSRGVFHGRIYVHPVAQKTDAKQTNKNLLLSEEATANTKPQLEIYADDVKCTHGATIGQLNEESLFYLRARGLGPHTAKRMLIHAFAGEIIERIRHEGAREELDKLIWDRLEANEHISQAR